MRTYTDIFKSYLEFMEEITGDDQFEYKTFMELDDEKVQKALCYKNILELCYDKDKGFFYFLKFIIGDLKHLGFPRPLRYNQLFRKWDKLIKKHDHLVILCSRGHGKSLFFSQLYQLYDMFIHPSRKILIESASQEQADILIEEIRRIVDNNEWLKTKKNPDKWRTSVLGYNNGFILGKGFGSEVRGLHLDRIVIDDILRSDNKLTPQQIEDFVDLVLEPMLLNRGGQLILVGTPMNEKDIFTTVKSRAETGGVWKVFEFPAIIDYETKKIQCPDRFTFEMLMNKRATMGSLKFDREYQLKLFSKDQSLFPYAMIEIAKDKGKAYYLHHRYDTSLEGYTLIAGVDVARSGSVSADYTVMVVLAYHPQTQEKRIVGFWREKGLKIAVQAERIANMAKNFNNCVVIVEENNIGQDMIDELADTHNVFVESFKTTHKSKDEIIRFLINSFEHEQLIIPQRDENSKDNMKILEDELVRFGVSITPAGNEVYGALTGHDDCVPPESLIQTINGLIPIKDIKIGDLVLTHKGRYRPVTKLGNRYAKNLVTIDSTGKIPIRITENHNLLLKNRNIKYLNNTTNVIYGEDQWLNYDTIKNDYKKYGTVFTVNTDVVDIEQIDLSKTAPDTYVCENDKLVAYTYNGTRKNSKQNVVDRYLKVDNDFCRIIGYYMAEGTTGKHNVGFASHKDEINIRKFSKKYFENLGMNVCENIKNNGANISFGSMVLNKFFKQFGSRDNKQLPSEFLFLPIEKQKEIVIGWLLGDGTFKKGNIRVATISRELANQMYIFMVRNGITPSLREQKGQNGHKKLYIISLSFSESKKIIKDIEKIYWKEKGIFERNTQKDQTMIKRIDNSIVGQIRNIKVMEYNDLVYNLEVDEDNSYVVENTVVHNCVMSLAIANKGTQSYSMPFAMSDFGKEFQNTQFRSPYQYLDSGSKETDLFNRFKK